MFGFLQGFSYGLLISCLPWLLIGLVKPRVALPTEPPKRWHAILRYAFAAPTVVLLAWTTSLWGGFEPSVVGWLAGLAAIPAEIFVERRWRAWQHQRGERRREAAREAQVKRWMADLERQEREQGLLVLDPARPPQAADAVVLGLCEAKRSLQLARRPDLATQADQFYTRYTHVGEVLRGKFDARELTYERARGLVAEVCRNALDNLTAMASLAHGVASIDAEFVRRRLTREAGRLSDDEQQALSRRLALVDDTERRLRDIAARNEAALTALDDTAVAVAGIETGRSQAAVTAEQALQDLRHFADRAGLYGRSGAAS